jgi:hypothetical protein
VHFPQLPAFGRLMGNRNPDLTFCRWCWGRQERAKVRRHSKRARPIVCANCDDPNGKPIPDGDGAPRP